MPRKKPTNARAVATTVLNDFDKSAQHHYAGSILNKFLAQTDEKQRATDLVFGTIRNQAAIDMVIAQFADCPTSRIPSRLVNIIRVGVYELVYAAATAEYAIVNEAVVNARKVAGKKQVGFVNAVLRQISRHIKKRQILPATAEPKRTLPQTSTTGCEFDCDILPGPEDRPSDYLSGAFSLPKWLVTEWLIDFGFEKTRQICFASNRKAGIYLRPNMLKTSTEQLSEKLRQKDIDFEIVPGSSMIRVKGPAAVTELPGFAEGLFSIQDLTATETITILRPQSTWIILDFCASPGGKTTQLAEITGDKAKIIATDINSERLERIRENITRLGIKSVSVVEYEDVKKIAAKTGAFDCVLVDVPCSNTGVLSRRPEVRLRINKKTIAKLAKTQLKLIETAAQMLKPKGKICYSTCSIQRTENSELVKVFLQNNPDFKLESENLILPLAEGFDHDGGYAAILAHR